MKIISIHKYIALFVITKTEYNLLLEWLEKGRKLHKKYGGKIFAIGKILDSSFIDLENSNELLLN